MKNGLILYHEYLEHFEFLSDEELGQLLRAALLYDKDGTLPEFNDKAVMMAFSFIKTNTDIAHKKYVDKCEKNRQNGMQGGRPSNEDKSKKTERFSEEPKKTERFSEKPYTNTNTKTKTKTNTNTNTNTKTDTDNSVSQEKRKRFVPPTRDEVQAYCQERKNNVDPQRFIDYYTANGWKVGKNPMKDWKAAVRTWEQNNIDDAGSRRVASQRGDPKSSRYDFEKLQRQALAAVNGVAVPVAEVRDG